MDGQRTISVIAYHSLADRNNRRNSARLFLTSTPAGLDEAQEKLMGRFLRFDSSDGHQYSRVDEARRYLEGEI